MTTQVRPRLTATTPVPSPATEAPSTFAAAKNLIVAAAKQHDVVVHAQETSFFATDAFTLAHAPLAGIEKYTDEDFAKGVAIQVLVVHSRRPQKLPNGSYLVTAKLPRRATEGTVSFIAENGSVAARRPLIVRAQKEVAGIFPDVYVDPAPGIPVITSTHVWIGDQNHVGEANYGHWGVDCSGWSPYRTLYYWTD